MGKKKQKQKSQIKVEDVKAATLMPIDDERITKIIVNALVEYDKIKEENEIKRKKEEQEKFYKLVGYKNYEEVDNRLKRIIAILFNRVVVFFRIITMSQKRIKGTRASVALLKIIPYRLLKGVSIFLLGISIALIAFIPIQLVFTVLPQWENYQYIIAALASFITYVFSQVFRLAYIEIDLTEDQNFIFGTFTAVTTMISIIIAIIALIK